MLLITNLDETAAVSQRPLPLIIHASCPYSECMSSGYSKFWFPNEPSSFNENICSASQCIILSVIDWQCYFNKTTLFWFFPFLFNKAFYEWGLHKLFMQLQDSFCLQSRLEGLAQLTAKGSGADELLLVTHSATYNTEDHPMSPAPSPE